MRSGVRFVRECVVRDGDHVLLCGDGRCRWELRPLQRRDLHEHGEVPVRRGRRLHERRVLSAAGARTSLHELHALLHRGELPGVSQRQRMRHHDRRGRGAQMHPPDLSDHGRRRSWLPWRGRRCHHGVARGMRLPGSGRHVGAASGLHRQITTPRRTTRRIRARRSRGCRSRNPRPTEPW